MPNLVLLAGVPGVGKSTFASTFFDLHYAIVSSDAIRQRLAGSLRDAHQEQIKPWPRFYADIEDRLRMDIDVVADATFLTQKHRHRARAIADATNADLHLILFQDWLTASQRNAARDAELRVPGEAMLGLLDLYWTTLAQLPEESYTTVTKIDAFQ